MKIMAANQITAVTPSSEDSAYPAEYVLNDFRTLPWKAGSAVESTLTLDISANSNGLMLSYMNSSQVTVEVKDNGGSTIYGPTAHSIDSYKPNLWVDYTLQAGVAQAVLTFSNPGSAAPYCGMAWAAYAYNFSNPQYGMNEDRKEYVAVDKRLNSGARDYDLIAVCRTFKGQFRVLRSGDFYTFMDRIPLQYGNGPYAMRVTDVAGQDWAVFGWLKTASGDHDSSNYSMISIDIEEAV